MGRLVLYIATSLDGYIADSKGGVAWLENFPNRDNSDYGYFGFYDSIGTVVMGRKTYEQILSFDVPWPYSGRDCYVISSQEDFLTHDDSVKVLLPKQLDSTILTLQKTESKDIWLVGGAELISLCLDKVILNEMQLTVIPTILGDGIPLFKKGIKPSTWRLKESKTFSSGVVQQVYVK